MRTGDCLSLCRAYQVAHNDLWAGLHSEVQWCEFGCILHSGVNVNLHADQEKHTLNVRVLHSYVKEVTSLVVNLSRDRKRVQPEVQVRHAFAQMKPEMSWDGFVN